MNPIPLQSKLGARSFIATTLLAMLAACSTAPLSYLDDRQVTDKAVLHRVPVFVDAVDGDSTAFRPVAISPGEHLVTMHAPPVAGFALSVNKTVPMTIEPCTRYYIAAQRPAVFSQDWELVIERTYPVAGCNRDEELRKAHTARASSIESSNVALTAPRAVGQ